MIVRTSALCVSVLLLSGVQAGSRKRGFVADGCTGASCMDASLLTGAAWFYDYNLGCPYAPSAACAERFSPMNWCLSTFNDTPPAGTNTTYVMGPNEPNLAGQCNKSGQQVAAAWSAYLSAYPSSQLVSPATAGNGSVWLDAFYDACTHMYGAAGCRVSFTAVHDYSCDPSSTMSYLQYIYTRYGLPVWLTEFSCGDGAQGRPMADQLAFMKAIFPMLDAAPYVYRYAWMSANDPKGNRGLVETVNGVQQLTPVGQLFNSL